MKIGLTGSTGLIGSYFLKNFGNTYEIFEFKGDMTNSESINKFVNSNYDVIFHLASVIPKYDEKGIPLKQSFSSNIIGTENIAKAASKFKTKIIFPSSQRVYDYKNNFPINETDKLKPHNDYGISKLESERKLQQFLDPELFTILRISNIYGTYPKRSSIIDSIAESLVIDKPVKIGLNPKILRDYLHIDDLLHALNLSIKHNGVFNICLGESYNVNNLINFFKIISGKTPRITFGDYDSNDIILDNTKAKNEMKFIPKFVICKGIEKVLSDIHNIIK